MLTSSSPEIVPRLRVSRPMKPRTTVPLAAFGVIVSVIVPVWPGARVTGEYGALALTLCAHTSPEVEVTAESNGLVFATAARLTVPVVPEVNGPVASGRAKKNPGATSGAARAATELLPDDTPSTSGSPKAHETSIVIGTVP